MSGQPRGVLQLNDSGWLAALMGEAMATAEASPRRSGHSAPLSDLDHDVHDLLWSRGVLFGGDVEATPRSVRGGTEGDAALLQTIHLLLIEGARLLAVDVQFAKHPQRLRWQLGALVASMAGQFGVAVVLEEAAREGHLAPSDEHRLFGITETWLVKETYRLGNPPDGFPLHAAMTFFDARAFLRLAEAQTRRGGYLRRRAVRVLDRLSQTKALYFELLAGVFAASTESGNTQPEWPKVAARQLRSLSLLSRDRRAARRGLNTPQSPTILLQRVPKASRAFVLEQVVLAALLARRWTPPVHALLFHAATANGLSRADVETMAARAAAFLINHEKAALALATPGEQTMLHATMGTAMDSFHAAAHSIAQEIRETHELGVFLARMAQGERLTPDERTRMRTQLIDLAKVVPSLAIFAAPGGMILLPVILKLLPFDLRPSAFQSRPPQAPLPVDVKSTGTS